MELAKVIDHLTKNVSIQKLKDSPIVTPHEKIIFQSTPHQKIDNSLWKLQLKVKTEIAKKEVVK